MSDVDSEPGSAPEPAPAPTPAPPAPMRLVATIALAGALLLVIALVATAPGWAPLLPWGQAASERGPNRDIGAGLDRLRQALRDARDQADRDAAAAAAAQHRIETRLAALEAKQAAPATDLGDLDRRLSTLTGAVGELGNRVSALDKTVQARPTDGMTDVAMALAIMQIRNAVAAGRPFPVAYATLVALAHGRPDVAAAAAPLAAAAATGVASRAALAEELRALAAELPAGKTAAAPSRWTAAILQRLRNLVTIRRIDGGGAGGVEDILADAQRKLAAGDLAGAVAAVDKLSGPDAAAAAPWLQRARRRLAVTAALQRAEATTAARLGTSLGGAATGTASSP